MASGMTAMWMTSSTVIGISTATVAKMTKGEFVSMQVLYRICKELDVDFNDVISMYKSNSI